MTTAEIQIRTNLYLWLLTGRSRDFVNQALNTSIEYSVRSTPEEVSTARRFLRLDDRRTDFHTLSVLAAARMSKPLLRSMPMEHDAVFVPGLLRLPKLHSTAEMLPPAALRPPYVNGATAGRRNFTKVIFRAEDAQIVRIDTDNESFTTHVSPFTLVPEDGGTYRLKIDRADNYGIYADFRVDSWNPGDTVVVTIAPSHYPYATVAERLRADRVMLRLMTAEDTLGVFEASAANPALQVGMAGLAIIRRMLKWVRDDQAGFRVTDDGKDITVEPTTLAIFHSPQNPDA